MLHRFALDPCLGTKNLSMHKFFESEGRSMREIIQDGSEDKGVASPDPQYPWVPPAHHQALSERPSPQVAGTAERKPVEPRRT